MPAMKSLKEHMPWWKISTPLWMSIVFIVFCVTMAIIAAVTVDDNPKSKIELKVSKKTKNVDDLLIRPGKDTISLGTKRIYWRVDPTEVPRWKRMCNRWHPVRKAVLYKNTWVWEQDSKWGYYYNMNEFNKIKHRYTTVEEMKSYQQKQLQNYRRNKYSARKKAMHRKFKNDWKETVEGDTDWDDKF